MATAKFVANFVKEVGVLIFFFLREKVVWGRNIERSGSRTVSGMNSHKAERNGCHAENWLV